MSTVPYRNHARRHLPGGTDPLEGLLQFPSGDTKADKILAALPAGFWKLNEDSGSVAADSSGDGQDLSTTSPEVDPLWGAPAGPPGEQAADFQNGTGGFGGTASRVSRDWPLIDHSFTAGIWVKRNDSNDTLVMGQGNVDRSPHTNGWELRVTGSAVTPPNKPMAWLGGTDILYALNPLAAGVWAFMAVTYDDDTGVARLYVDGLLHASSAPFTFAPASGDLELWVGHDDSPGGAAVSPARFTGSYAFLVNRAMSGTELAGIVEAPATAEDAAADHTGDVLTLDEDGHASWQPPGVEVTHGDGAPSEAPATSPPSLSGPTSGSGWHLDAHVETAVLYDSSPARFDVPSRTWLRVPFNNVRIQRRWETELNGPIVSAWLPDDRGLTSQAANGLLHITADMQSPQAVSGWFAIEYPILDFTGLPDYPGETGVDAYARAARIVDASSGEVLRVTPGSSDRQFFEWLFRDFAADGLVGIAPAAADSPYPVYATWAARPLLKPAPYPQIDPASSRTYYMRDAFYGGFSHEYGLGVVDADLSAGANLCLQAWQDSPWLLRFSTDHFPNYTPLPYPELWKQRPYLAVSYSYDPDSVDHDTGRLL